MKITVITPRLAISGVCLAQIRFARALAMQGHEVDLIIGVGDPAIPDPVVAGVNVIMWHRPRVVAMFMPIVAYLRSRAPDLVFTAEDHLNSVVLFAAIVTRSKAKISGSSRVTPFDTYSNTPLTKRWILKQFMHSVMWRANALTCVSQDMVAQYAKVFPGAPYVYAYNVIDDPLSRDRLNEPVDDAWFLDDTVPVVVGAGMLEPWKGFDDLIRGFAVMHRRGRVARLVILGEGSERKKLETLVAELGLQDWVRLPGRTSNPLKLFARAKVFVLSSHVEGMPNVLIEAMMCGCTVVSYDCPTGPRELLQSPRYGYLIEKRDPEALADGIGDALDRPVSRERMAEAIRPFEHEAVVKRQFEILGMAG